MLSSKGRRFPIGAVLYVTLLSVAALCVAGLCVLKGSRASASAPSAGGARPSSATDRRYRYAAGGQQNQTNANNANAGGNTNTPPAGNMNAGSNANNQNQGGDKPAEKPADKPAEKPADGGAAAQPVCKDVSLGPAGPNAEKLAAQLDKTAGMTAKPIAERVILLCGPARVVDNFRGVAQRLTGSSPDRAARETHYVRLFFLRKAADIADAINKTGRLSASVKAIGDDILVFPSESDADDEAIHQFKRWISVVDVPRPEISLMTWSVQISSGSPETINRESVRIRSAVSGFNDRLQSALEQGWWFLESSRRLAPANFYAPNLSSYLSNRYLWTRDGAYDAAPDGAPQPPCWSGFDGSAGAPHPLWGADRYCLGYTRILNPIQPSLTSMLLALIAAQPTDRLSRARELRDDFVNCMENRDICPEVHAPADRQQQQRPMRPQGTAPVSIRSTKSATEERLGTQDAASAKQYYTRLYDFALQAAPPLGEEGSCEFNDLKLLQYQNEQGNRPSPGFSCFREQLQRSLGSAHLGEMRRALADFLFQYKSAEYYPQDFVAWNQTASSQVLDTMLDPLIVAFNRDLNVYLRHIQEEVAEQHRTEKKATFESDGIVTARVISGNTAKVETTTQSFFKQPPTLNVRDVLTQLANSPTPTLAPVASGTGAELIAAAIRAEQRMVARVGRNLNIEVTSNTLKGASACEMNVALNSAEADKPSMLNTVGAGTSADDNLSRVATHNTNTKVRVDSTKLFEVSSFAAALVHGRSIPLVPPGVDLPYIGSIARLRLKPGTVYHRSFAIVSAVIVPTAADLANMIEFSEDLEALPLARGEVQLLAHTTPTPTPKPTPEQQRADQQQKPCRRHHGRRRCPPPPAPPAPAAAPAPPQPTTTVYYWIVAHYRDGDAVSGPFRVNNAASATQNGTPLINDEHPITLLWRAPESALSFDLIRANDRTDLSVAAGKWLLATDLSGSAFIDDDSSAQPYVPAAYHNGQLSRMVFSRIVRPAGNLRAFHKAMLDCIEDEAGGAGNTCDRLYLSAFPPEGRSQ